MGRRRSVGKTGASRCSLGIENGGTGNISSRVRLSPKDVSAGSSHPSQKVVPHPPSDSTPYPRPRESHEKIGSKSLGSSKSTSQVDLEDPRDLLPIIAVLALTSPDPLPPTRRSNHVFSLQAQAATSSRTTARKVVRAHQVQVLSRTTSRSPRRTRIRSAS